MYSAVQRIEDLAVDQDANPWVELGKPGNDGKAFAITFMALDDKYKGDPSRFPRPDYEHAIFHDPITDNYIVCRRDKNGDFGLNVHRLKRVR